MVDPAFFLIGAQKAGTTSLYFYLNQHPEIRLAQARKAQETHYFSISPEIDLSTYISKFYGGFPPSCVAGDYAASYIFLPFAPSRIHKFFPDAKILAILRDPVERAHSHWWMLRSRRSAEDLDFGRAIAENLHQDDIVERLASDNGVSLWKSHFENILSGRNIAFRTYVERGYYAEQLQRYVDLFGGDSLKVFFLDDLRNHRKKMLSEICQFLSIDPGYDFKESTARNPSLPMGPAKIARTFADIGFDRLLPDRVKEIGMSTLSKFGSRPDIPSSLRRDLNKHYEPYNLDLERLLGRKLPF